MVKAIGIKDTSGGNYEALDITSTTSTTVQDDADATKITLSSPETIVEGQPFTVTATVGSAVTGTPLVITLDNDQTITIPVGAKTGSVNIETRADDEYSSPHKAVLASVALSRFHVGSP